MKLLIPIFALIFLSNPETKSNYVDISSQPDTLIVFSDHLTLIGQHSDDFGGTSFKPISVFFDNKLIFKDSLNEYWLTGYESMHYPKLLICANGSCQLLIEVDERPNNNELFRLSISKFGNVAQDRLPLFYWNPREIDNDGNLEVRAQLSNGETIADGDTAFYNPILVYELSENCLSLDTLTTIHKNEKVWGKFHGFYYNDTLLLPYNRNEW